MQELDKNASQNTTGAAHKAPAHAASTAAGSPSPTSSPAPSATRVAKTPGAPDSKKKKKPKAQIALFALFTVIGLLVGGLLTYFLAPQLGAGAKSNLNGKATITKDELDTRVGSFVYEGKTYTVTAREAMMTTGAIEQFKSPDGKYYLPSAESIVGFARNKVLELVAKSEGLSATDSDVKDFLMRQSKTDDIKQLAARLHLKEDQVKTLAEDGVLMEKLRDKVIGKDAIPQPVAPPQAPKDTKDNSKKTEDYYAYITKILGKEWDSAKATWASKDGPLYKALGSQLKLDGKTASYEDANEVYRAYSVELQQKASTLQQKWIQFVSKYLSQARISVDYLLP